MSLFSIFVIFVVVSASNSEANTTLASPNYFWLYPTESESVLKSNNKCGGILTEKEDGIRYKQAMTVNPNERCIWVINVPMSDYYEVEIILSQHEQQQDPSTTGLCISKIDRWSKKIQCAPEINMKTMHQAFTLECNMIIVTFYSRSNVHAKDRGFSLKYHAFRNDYVQNKKVQTTDAFILPLNGKSKWYPEPEGSNYTNNALAVFVTPLQGNTYIGGNMYNVMYRAYETGLYGNKTMCHDHLNVYTFEMSMDGRGWNWKFENNPEDEKKEQTICPGMSELDTDSTDLVVHVFSSDSRGTGPGFSLASEKK